MNPECVQRVVRSLGDDEEFQNKLKEFVIHQTDGFGSKDRIEIATNLKPRRILEAFTESIKPGRDVSNYITDDLTLKDTTSEQINRAFGFFCDGVSNRCKSRKNFQKWFDEPDMMERGIGVIIFTLIFLYGWLGEETSSAFSDAMQSVQKTNAEMSLFELLLANYLMMGSFQILWAMIVALAKSWVLMVALLATFYFVEAFIVESALNPMNVAAVALNAATGNNCVDIPAIPVLDTLHKSPMKSIRIALFFVTDKRVLYAILFAILISLLFACCAALYLAMSKSTPEDAKFVGKLVCMFQLITVFSFVLFAMLGSNLFS
jgi:hypothetical protein